MDDFIEHTYSAQDGLSLYYRTYGPQLSYHLPVLCLPGLTRNADDFHNLAERLAQSRQVITLDYRGRGRSAYDPDPTNYQPRTYLEDIRHLLVIVGVHRVIVVGTSMGGLLAMGLGVIAPSTLAGVILNDIGPGFGAGLRSILAYAGTDRPMPNWESATQEFRRVLKNTVFQTDDDMDKAIRATWREASDGVLHVNWDIRLVQPLLNRESLPDLWKLFSCLRRVPVLALRGELSDILDRNTLHRMAKEHGGLTQIEVKQTGHAPSLNEPEAVKAIDAFLEPF
jgi:pimeloyl-ACP methyl ester carboxylesterase